MAKLITTIIVIMCLLGFAGLAVNDHNKKNNIQCSENYEPLVYTVYIQNSKVSPAYLDAARCDKMVITNLDPQDRVITFGEHDNHVAYDGVKERTLNQNQSMSLTLRQAGSFLFHDHQQYEIRGTFRVR